MHIENAVNCAYISDDKPRGDFVTPDNKLSRPGILLINGT
jgi:hypothetical protein